MRSYLDSGLIPVAILNMQYNCIKSNAFEDNLLHMEGIELFDVEEREESPYEERTCFIASAATIQSDSTVVDFIFPEHLYITNDTRIVDRLEVDFDEGSGWQIISFNDVVRINYATAKNAKIGLKLVFEDETERISYFFIEIKPKVYKFAAKPHRPIMMSIIL